MDLEAVAPASLGAVTGALGAALLLRSQLRELLGLDLLQRDLAAALTRIEAMEDLVASLRADTSGTSEGPRARAREVDSRLTSVEQAVLSLRAEVGGRLSDAQALIGRVLTLLEAR